MNHWTAQAPANIALIKYMGKLPGNKAVNPSLSYSSSRFSTKVKVALSDLGRDVISKEGFGANISSVESDRFFEHIERVRSFFSYQGFFEIFTENNFPPSCGLASSASSFAALTQALAAAITAVNGQKVPSAEELANISRLASGSSCRSFFKPWSVWDGEFVGPIDLPYKNIEHYVVVVNNEKKMVSSSEAHSRVRSSYLFNDRVMRAKKRYDDLLVAFSRKQWRDIYEIVWSDFWDMHAMFETSNPSFGYILPDTMRVLSTVRKFWDSWGDGPLATLDAGPNIHLIFRGDQADIRKKFIHQFQDCYQILGG